MLAFFLTVVITVATAYGETRYRAAAEVPFVILAGVGIEAVLTRNQQPRGNERAQAVDEEPAPKRYSQALGPG